MFDWTMSLQHAYFSFPLCLLQRSASTFQRLTWEQEKIVEAYVFKKSDVILTQGSQGKPVDTRFI